MKTRLSRDEKKKQAVIDLINKMFEIAGHSVTFQDVEHRKDEWYLEWTITMEQDREWKQWGKKYLIKELKMPSKLAEREMAYVGLGYGLKFSNFEK